MARPAVIDLYACETESDGTRVYRPPMQALAAQVASGAIWLVTEYPQETFQILTLALIADACVWWCRYADYFR
jgi:hypothetical protein